ncbi:hypothetical protein ACIGEZ_33910 [Streptomyces sp. NPDC085481]|uniref:hypothetical protein n=1 Tax=Streptomyces sp. NPDC085481 TaxID=3365727 RepID=UPI0037CFC9AB
MVDEFLNIYIPMIGREKEFCDGLLEDLDVLADLADCGESHGYVPYPSEGGLIPIAATYSGDQFYWRTAASEPDLWPIVISGANDDWWEFPGGVVSFLASWLGGTLERRGLPSGVPRAKPPVRLIE